MFGKRVFFCSIEWISFIEPIIHSHVKDRAWSVETAKMFSVDEKNQFATRLLLMFALNFHSFITRNSKQGGQALIKRDPWWINMLEGVCRKLPSLEL
jgi:hypothetical protein